MKDAVAFVVTVAAGITFGYLFTAVESLEDKLKARHSPAAHSSQHR